MYAELAVAFQEATKVELTSWIDETKQEVVFSVERYGQSLWRKRVARDSLADLVSVKELRSIHFEAGLKVVDQILSEVDWDQFFPIPDPPKAYLAAY